MQVFLYILASISEGLQALGGNLNYFTGTGTKLAGVFRARLTCGYIDRLNCQDVKMTEFSFLSCLSNPRFLLIFHHSSWHLPL